MAWHLAIINILYGFLAGYAFHYPINGKWERGAILLVCFEMRLRRGYGCQMPFIGYTLANNNKQLFRH